MKKILRVTLRVEDEIFAECSSLELEPYAVSIVRKFTFKNIKVKRDVVSKYTNKIKVTIYNSCKYSKRRQGLYDFDLFVLNEKRQIEGDWWVYGLVSHDYDVVAPYTQGVIDVFTIWQKGEVLDWFSLPIHSHLKAAYISACFYYSSLSTKILEKEVYQIDMILIKEENDFYYLISQEFFGDRGYMGTSFHGFVGCLLDIYHQHGYFSDKKIVFLNTKNLYSPEIVVFFEELKKIFLKYKFLIEELVF